MLRRLATAMTALAVALPLMVALSAPAGAASGGPAPLTHPSVTPALQYMAVAQKAVRNYTVRPGDTLSSIAARVYGSPKAWQALWWVNRARVRNPDSIRAGQVLTLSSWHPAAPAWLARRAAAAVPSTSVGSSVSASNGSGGSVGSSGFSAFEACVIHAESGGDPTAYNSSTGASGLFGMLLSTWLGLGLGYPKGAWSAPISVQEQGFNILYARDGTSPWAPYDGC